MTVAMRDYKRCATFNFSFTLYIRKQPLGKKNSLKDIMPPKKKVKKDDQIKDLETASGILLGYLKEQFRPYSINDIILNLHNKISKSVALKALALLATNNKLLMKTYGKMNFYVYRYGKDDQQQAIDESGKEITIQVVTDLENSFEEVKNRLKELNSGMLITLYF